MSLPNIKFNISKNGLGLLQADIQKVPGLVLTGVTVAGTNKVTVGNSYQIFSLEEAISLGIDETSNAFAYQQIKAFYKEAKKGAELWFMLVTATVTMTEMADLTKAYAKKFGIESTSFNLPTSLSILKIAAKGDAHNAIVDTQNNYRLFMKLMESGVDYLDHIKRIPHIINTENEE